MIPKMYPVMRFISGLIDVLSTSVNSWWKEKVKFVDKIGEKG